MNAKKKNKKNKKKINKKMSNMSLPKYKNAQISSISGSKEV
jgi:ABC-type Mn2+/Zn2+ transport system ATPase subunit